jgi:hypothetical protein
MINFAAVMGVLLILWAIPACSLGILQAFFVLQRRADTSPAVIGKTLLVVVQAFARIIAIPICGLIFLFQGWRLDPFLQFGVFMLGLGVIFESFSSVVGDYQQWRTRAGRTKPSIMFESQPSDALR